MINLRRFSHRVIPVVLIFALLALLPGVLAQETTPEPTEPTPVPTETAAPTAPPAATDVPPPTDAPTVEPTVPSGEPTAETTAEPTVEATAEITADPLPTETVPPIATTTPVVVPAPETATPAPDGRRILSGDQSPQPVFDPNEQSIIVQFNVGRSFLPGDADGGISSGTVASARSALAAAIAPYNAVITQTYDTIPYVTMTVDEAALAAIATLPQVVGWQYNELHFRTLNVSTGIIDAPEIWAEGYDGNGQVVAILDDGILANHTFFGGRVDYEACYSGGGTGDLSNCPGMASSATGPGAASMAQCLTNSQGADDCDHGTHVAGIAAGDGASFDGVARGADIMAVNVFSWVNNCGPGGGCVSAWTSDILAGLQYVYDQKVGGANVAAVNMSLGGTAFTGPCDVISGFTNPYYAAAAQLNAVGVAVIAASGNEFYSNAIGSPACVSNIISVGATDDFDEVPLYSNVAYFLDFLAPGGGGSGSGINSASASGTSAFENKSGTSMATPHVAGAFTVMRQIAPTATIGEIYTRLRETGEPVYEPYSGLTFPRINLGYAGISFIPFDIAAPNQGSTLFTSTPTYTWDDLGWPTYYEIIVAAGTKVYLQQWVQDGGAGATCNGTTCTFTPTTPVGEALGDTALTTYIRGYAPGYGAGRYSSESFTLLAPDPVGPAGPGLITSPRDGGLTFTWDEIGAADFYRLYVVDSIGQVGVDEWVSDSNCSSGDCSYEPDVVFYNGAYTWYLQAYTSAGLSPFAGPATFTVSITQPPDAPVQVGESLSGNNVTLEWTHGEGNTYYELYIASPGGGVAHNQWYTLDELTFGGGSYEVTLPLTGTGEFTWYVRGYGPGGYSAGSWDGPDTFTISGVAAPTGLSNSDPDVSDGILTFNWNHDARNTYYELIVIKQGGGTPISQWFAVNGAGLTCGGVCVASPNVMLANGTYDWYVRGYGPHGFTTGGVGGSGYAGELGVVVDLDAPDSSALNVTQFFASNNDVLDEVDDPIFTWNDIDNAAWYELIVIRQSDGVVVHQQWYMAVAPTCMAGDCQVEPGVIMSAGAYQWYVQAYGPAGAGVGGLGGGPFAGPAAFNITPDPIAAPTLVSPTGGGTLTTSTPDFAWNAAPGATWYQLVILNQGGQVVFQQWKHFSRDCESGCLWDSPVTLPNGAYQWYVQAYGPGGLVSAFAGPANFTIAVPPPGTPTLIAPADDAVSATNSVTFEWNTASNATYYYLSVRVGTTEVYGQWLAASAVCTTTCEQTVNLAGNQYTWRVSSYGQGVVGINYPTSAVRDLRVLD